MGMEETLKLIAGVLILSLGMIVARFVLDLMVFDALQRDIRYITLFLADHRDVLLRREEEGEEGEEAAAAAVQAAAAAESTASDIKALNAEVLKAYTSGSDTRKEILDLVVTAEGLGPNAEVAALLTQIGDIARDSRTPRPEC